MCLMQNMNTAILQQWGGWWGGGGGVDGLFTEIGYNYNSLFTHATDHFLNIYKSLKYYSIADFFYYLALQS